MKLIASTLAVVLAGAGLSAAAPVKADQMIVIPTILSLTGQAAFIGNEELQAVRLLESQANRGGGINGRKVHFDVVDDQSTPQLAVQFATAAIASKAPIVLGPILGSTCAAVTPLFLAGPVDYCLSPALHPPQGGFVFTAGASTTDLTAALVRYSRGRHWPRIAIVTTTDATGQDGDAGFARALSLPENRDITLVAHEHFSPADISIAAQMARIRAASPDVILTWLTGTPAGTVLHAYADAGMTTPIALNNGNLTYVQMRQFAQIMPQELIFAAYRFLSYETLNPGPLKDAQQAYYKGFGAIGIRPDIGQSLAWDPALIALSALAHLPESATPAQFRDYILGMRSFVGVNGLYNFSDGLQRGLTQNVCIVVRWNVAKQRWLQVSAPGGKPLHPPAESKVRSRMVFLRNTWYVAAWSADVAPGALVARTICEQPVVVGRTGSGALTALYDRCPHRFAALSAGKIDGENIVCGYHGLRFDTSGTCVHNPHGNKKIPPAATCRSFPLIEKHSIVWIWMGDEAPRAEEIPDFSILDVAPPELVAKRDYITMSAGYELITDNLLDLSHVNILHEGLLGNAAANDAEINVESDGSTVRAGRLAKNVPVPKLLDLNFRQDGANVDFWNEMRWDAPACMLLDAGVTEPGAGKAAGTGFLAIHLLTPETEYTTHYFFASVRVNPPVRPREEEMKIRDEVSRLRRLIFETQDEPMIALQQQRVRQASDGTRPSLLSVDAGPVRALRILHERIEREQAQAVKPQRSRSIESQAIEVDAEPDAIFEIVADPRNIPLWAPAFADAVTGDHSMGWKANKNGRIIGLRVVAERPARTVDMLREIAPGREGGAYIRVTPHPQAGSVVNMTIPVPPDGDAEKTALILREELAGLARLVLAQRLTL